MIFTAPYYLYALLGIFIPIAIHLWNRKKGKVIKVGSIKLFTESDSQRMSSLRLSEWFIMLLRISLIVVIVIIVSGAEIFTDLTRGENTVILIDPEYLEKDEMVKIIEVADESQEIRVLEKDFPLLTDSYVSSIRADYWTLINHLNQLSADSFVIYSPLNLSQFQSRLPRFKQNISWRTLPDDYESTFISKAYIDSSDSIRLLIGSNISNQLEYEYQSISTDQERLHEKTLDFNVIDSTITFSDDKYNHVKVEPFPSVSVGINVSKEYSSDKKYITTAFSSLERYASVEFDIENHRVDQVYDIVVWLDDEAYHKNVETGIILKMNINDTKSGLVVKKDYNIYELTKRVNPYFTPEGVILDFPQQLLTLLNESGVLPGDGYINDQRQINIEQLNAGFIANEESDNKIITSSANIDHWLWLFFLLLFMIERSLSLMKNA